jgi:hypothetical protein
MSPPPFSIIKRHQIKHQSKITSIIEELENGKSTKILNLNILTLHANMKKWVGERKLEKRESLPIENKESREKLL